MMLLFTDKHQKADTGGWRNYLPFPPTVPISPRDGKKGRKQVAGIERSFFLAESRFRLAPDLTGLCGNASVYGEGGLGGLAVARSGRHQVYRSVYR